MIEMVKTEGQTSNTEQFIEEHPSVREWLVNRAEGTRQRYGMAMRVFCEGMHVTPKGFLKLNRKKATALSWTFLTTEQEIMVNGKKEKVVYVSEKPASARALRAAFISFYRHEHGERLNFDAGRGGKHEIHLRYKRSLEEETPSTEQFFNILDMATCLRDKTLWLCAFQTGCRQNVFQSLTYGMVKDKLDSNMLMLKITENHDSKLRHRNVPFYYTFLHQDAIEALREYCKKYHSSSSDDTPLFYARLYKRKTGKKPIWRSGLLMNYKNAVIRSGLDPKKFNFHGLRKACRKVLRHTKGLDDDYVEFRMGHTIKGSRSNYLDRHDIEFFKQQEALIDFSRNSSNNDVKELRERLEEKDREIQEVRQNGYIKTNEIKTLNQKYEELLAYTMKLSQVMLDEKTRKKLPMIDLKPIKIDGEPIE